MKSIIEELLSNRKIILTTHIHPDGDALGSLYALYCALKQLKIKASIVVDSDQCHVPFKIISSKLPSIDPDSLVVVVDACEKNRVPLVLQSIKISNFIFIDHHLPKVKIKAAKYFISPNASSAGEIIFVLITKYLKLKISKELAIGIYTALITDTRSFKYARTTALAHKIAYHFIKDGLIKPELIQAQIYNRQKPLYLKFVGHVLSNFKVFKNIAYLKVSKAVLKKYRIKDHQLKSCFTDLFSIENIVAVVLMYEKIEHNNIIIKSTKLINFDSFQKHAPKISKYSCLFELKKEYTINKIVKNMAKLIN